ncbi:hypothetical protein [Halorientalis sp.]|uniref:hypothetical protein n=1 Tax=Halorientalis sp. TaxID=1931229 RepID=UPI00261FD39C|nr:hypothetical protein [Halorientalis sp.]
MSLDIRQALQAGYEDLTSEAGLNVFSVLLVFNVAYDAVSQSFRQQLLVATRGVQTRVGFPPPYNVDMLAFEFPLSVLVALIVAAVVAQEAVRFWAIQQFADISAPTLKERARVLLAVGGGVALFVYGVRQVVPVVWDGPDLGMGIRSPLVAAVAAAPILLVTVYLRQEIALTAAGPTETMRNSVARFRKAPVQIFGLLLLFAVLGFLPRLPTVVVTRVVTVRYGSMPSLILELLHSTLFVALSTFSIAAITDAYLQVRGGGDEGGPE